MGSLGTATRGHLGGLRRDRDLPAVGRGGPRGGIKGGVNPSSYGRWEDKVTLDDSGQGPGGFEKFTARSTHSLPNPQISQPNLKKVVRLV